MKKQFLEAGKIVNTHGVRGEVKIQPWADSPEFLLDFKELYIDGKSIKVISSKPHKGFVIAKFEGIEDINAAMPLKNKTIFINREDAKLEDGSFFLQDLIGISVVDADSGEEIGRLTDILELPSGNVYVVKGQTEHMIPAVPEFVIETNPADGYMRVHLIEGM